MEISVSYLGGATIIKATGDMSDDHLLRLVQTLSLDEARMVVFDLSEVNHVSTAGLGQMINIQQEITQKHGRASWVVISPIVIQAIKRTGLVAYLNLCYTVSDGRRVVA